MSSSPYTRSLESVVDDRTSVVRQTRDCPRVSRSAVLPTADRYHRRATVCIPGVERNPKGRHQHRPSSFGRLPSHPSTAAASGRHGTTAGWVRPVGAVEDCRSPGARRPRHTASTDHCVLSRTQWTSHEHTISPKRR